MFNLKEAVGCSIAVLSMPWLVILAGNLGLFVSALAFGNAVPAWQFHAETTWQVTRYVAAFVVACWGLATVFSPLEQTGETRA